jgi:hypothetical protein
VKPPLYKYAIGFVDYDCEEYNGGRYYSGGPYLAILEFDGDDWIEVDRWASEGEETVEQIAAWELDANQSLAADHRIDKEMGQ